eukprot:10904132-Alexandrium_andersonii.AAC.1
MPCPLPQPPHTVLSEAGSLACTRMDIGSVRAQPLTVAQRSPPSSARQPASGRHHGRVQHLREHDR